MVVSEWNSLTERVAGRMSAVDAQRRPGDELVRGVQRDSVGDVLGGTESVHQVKTRHGVGIVDAMLRMQRGLYDARRDGGHTYVVAAQFSSQLLGQAVKRCLARDGR